MKKIIYLVLLVMLIPNIVMADSAGPSILGYDAIVINKNGAKVKEGNEIIPYNSIVHVVDERDNYFGDDISYVQINWKDIRMAWIPLKDIKPFEEEQVIDSNESIGKVIIMNENGAKLWKGTSSKHEAYDKIIPMGTKVNIIYDIDYYKGLISWYYVNDGEFKGWVKSSDVDYIYQEAMLFSETKLYDENDNIIMTLPKGTIIDEIYMSNIKGKMIVEYQDQKGYVKATKQNEVFDKPGINGINLGLKTDDIILLTNNIELELSNNKKITIPSNTRIKILYGMIDGEMGTHPVCLDENNCYYYVNYQNQKGFIKVANHIILYELPIGIPLPDVGISTYDDGDDDEYNFSDEADHTIYSKEVYDYIIKNPTKMVTDDIRKQYATNVKLTDKAIRKMIIYQTIEENNVFYEATFVLIKYNNENYLVIDRDYYESLNIEKMLKEKSNENKQQENNNEISEEKNIDDKKDNNSKEEIITPVKDNSKKKSNSSNTIIFAVAGAVILAIVSFIIIKIINNRNKKVKNQEEKTIEANKEKDIKEIVKEENVIEKREVTIESNNEKK